MTKQLTNPDRNINLAAVIQTVSGKAADKTSQPGILQRLVDRFWAYTEKSAEADTSSYKGLL